jgi:hypothetical protein
MPNLLYKKLQLPPNSANAKVMGSIPTVAEVNAKFVQAGVTASDLNPIDWRKKVSLSPVLDQAQCGDCWAMSSTSALADRFIIQKQLEGLELQPAFVAQCSDDNSGCNGGQPYKAGKYFEKYGMPAVDDNCPSWSDICNLCASIPTCDDLSSNCSNSVFYYAIPHSTQNLTVHNGNGQVDVNATIANIKRELTNGPVVGSFFVPKDFMAASPGFPNTYKWEKTKGIYINGMYNDVLHKSKYEQGKRALAVISKENWSDIILEDGSPAAHAVSIVGWDRDHVPGIGDVSYWIIRNSWGENFMDGGFYKFAMNDNGLNANLGLDIPTRTPDGLFGGCVSFDPDLSTGGTRGEIIRKKSKNHLNIIVIIIIMICVVFFLYLFFRKKN